MFIPSECNEAVKRGLVGWFFPEQKGVVGGEGRAAAM